jgi:hypothetical protein
MAAVEGHNDKQEKTYPTNIGLLDANVTVVNSYHAEMCKFWDDNNFFSYGWVN